MFRNTSARLTLIVVVLISQALTSALGSALVHCSDGRGHEAIEVALIDSCHGHSSPNHDSDAANILLNTRTCVDESVRLTAVIAREPHRVVAPTATGVAYMVAEFSRPPLPSVPATDHVLPADSARSLIRSIVLLI